MLKTFKKLSDNKMSCIKDRNPLLRRFSKNNEGIAALEFALLAPLLLALMLGSIEITQSVWADGKVEQATSTVGDLVSRTPVMSDNAFRGLGEAGPLIISPNPRNDLNFTVTSIIGCLDDPDDATSNLKYYVLWSRVWQDGQASASTFQVDTQFDRQPNELAINDGETLIVTEGLYNFAPTIARQVGTSYEMGGVAFHQPRSTSARITYPGVESSEPRSCADFRP